MNIIGMLVSNVVEAQKREDQIDMFDPKPQTALEQRFAEAIMVADAGAWKNRGHHEEFRPSVRQAETAVVHARAIIADLLFDTE